MASNNYLKPYSSGIEIARIILVVMELLVACLSLVAIMTFGYLLKYFHWHCPLYSKMMIKIIPTHLSNKTVYIGDHMEWGKKDICWFSFAVFGVIIISNFIWAWMHLHFKRQVHQEGIFHSYVFISIIFEIILFLFSLVSSLRIISGEKVWCEYLVKHVQYTCREVLQLNWKYTNGKQDLYMYIQVTKVFSCLTSLSLLLVALFAFITFYGSSLLCCKDGDGHRVKYASSKMINLPYSSLQKSKTSLNT